MKNAFNINIENLINNGIILMNIKEQEIIEKYLDEASAADYAKLSTSELKDLLNIFKNVGRSAAKPVLKSIKIELNKRLGEDYAIKEAKVVPFKKLEQAWTRTGGDKAKQAKLIKKHDLKRLISSVRPGEIKLGIKNKLLGTTKAATAAGLDLDDQLIFVTNNPLKIIYPKKSGRRPEGEEIKESNKVKDVSVLRLQKIVSLTINEDNEDILKSFISSANIDINTAPSKIREAYKAYKQESLEESTKLEEAKKVIAQVELWNGKKMKKSFKNQSAAEKFIKKMQDQEDVRGYNMYAEGLEEAKSVKVKTRTGSDKYDYDELLPEVQKIVIMSKHVKKNKRMDLAKKITKDIISGKIKNADISSDLATLIGINQPYTGAAPKAAITDRMKELKLESTELEEALSPAYKKAEFQLYSLEKSLKAGSNLNKDVNKLFGDDFKQEFKNMEKYLGQILDIWEDSIEMAITFGESTELEEAKMSRDYKTAEFQLYSLEKSLKVGSKLNKDVNKILGNDLKREFRKMEKHLRQILDIWEEIEMGITFGESTELEEAKNAIVQH